jgi:hypothetical protein
MVCGNLAEGNHCDLQCWRAEIEGFAEFLGSWRDC